MRYIFDPKVRVVLAWGAFGATLIGCILMLIATYSLDLAVLSLPKTPQESMTMSLGGLWLLTGVAAKIFMADAAASKQVGRKSLLTNTSVVLSLVALGSYGFFWAVVLWGGSPSSSWAQMFLPAKLIFWAAFFSMPPVDLYNIVYGTFRKRIG